MLPEAFRASTAVCKAEGNNAALERLGILKNYIDGRWQRYRFGVGALLIALLVGLTFTGLASLIASRTAQFSSTSLLSFAILLHVAGLESWAWGARVKRRISLNLVEDLEERYAFEKIETAQQKPL